MKDFEKHKIQNRIKDLKMLAGHKILGLNSFKDMGHLILDLAYIDGCVNELEDLLKERK